MQTDAPDELDVEVDHLPARFLIAGNEGVLSLCEAARGVFNRGKCFWEELLERFCLFVGPQAAQLTAPPVDFFTQIGITELLELRFHQVDTLYSRPQTLEEPRVFGADNLLK